MKAIVAHANNRVIGANNGLPWNVPEDLAFFKKMTLETENVLFGKNTLDSLTGVTLRGRVVHVLSRSMLDNAEYNIFRDKQSVLEYASKYEIMIAGGEQVYTMFMPYITEIYITRVFKDISGDAFFPEYESTFRKESVLKTCDEFEISKWVRR